MNHRAAIKVLIIVVIGIVVAWSVVNISDYAHTFHASWVVWTMGAALGTANALSVYAFVMAKSDQVRRPAVIGIILFGGMSGTLQTLLYLQVGAPMLAALSFGWFGPVAEGVLAWLHAALSEEPATRKGTGKVTAKTPMQAHNATSMQAMQQVQDAEVVNISDRDRALQLHSDGYSPAEVSKMLNRNYQTVSSWIRRGAQVNGGTNV